jgi:hypothetical protein
MARNDGEGRRFTATHVTIMVVALSVTAAPVAVRAADMLVSISDPAVPSAQARVSDDGRLAVRGEVTQQAGAPSSEWHTTRNLNTSNAKLLWGAPPGSAVAIGQLTVSPSGGNAGHAELWLVSTFTNNFCDRERNIGFRPDRGEEIIFEASVPFDPRTPSSEQFTFPIPLTVEPSPTRGICVYVMTYHRPTTVSANGVRARPLEPFRAAQPKS